MTPKSFIALIMPAAIASAKKTGIPAGFSIAQAALESGWGGSVLTNKSNNLFNIKADSEWKGPTFSMPSRECLHGVWQMVPCLWRAYPGWLASIDDHATFLLTNERYAEALKLTADPEAFARAIQAAGYATDPAYADKIIAVMKTHNLEGLA